MSSQGISHFACGGAKMSSDDAVSQQDAGRRKPSKVAVPLLILLTGFFTPAAIGVIVRTYLAAVGKPVMSWAWIFGHIGMFLVLSLIWALPCAAIAVLASRRKEKGQPIGKDVVGAFIGFMAATILLFSQLWLDVEAVVMGAIIVPVLTSIATIIGGAVGWAVQKWRKQEQKPV
jgi:hypothetical protein